MLPGVAPLNGSPSAVAFSHVANANGSASSFTLPSVQAGDVIAVLYTASNASAPPPSSVTPSGFSAVVDATHDRFRSMIALRIMDGSESGSRSLMSGAASNRFVYVQLRPTYGKPTRLEWTNGTIEGSAGSSTAAITPPRKPAVLFHQFHSSNSINETLDGMTELSTSAGFHNAGYDIQTSGPTSRSPSITGGGTSMTTSGSFCAFV